jgi:diaminohydroxyphosphoribosylaminopyrimidine deaminase/5-amino-6-(5-phosphoribosylamino)uracil reductase
MHATRPVRQAEAYFGLYFRHERVTTTLYLNEQDEKYMRIALSLAETGKGRTSPNPIVGAVIVLDDQIVGFGAHLKAGKPHAEVHALHMAAHEAKGSTLYVTLEPCAHYGKTPPCADAVIAAGVSRVVVAVEDPFSAVAGQGIARMREAGLQVDVGCLSEEAEKQNAPFLHYARTGLPFITLKIAATLDGMIATNEGDSFYVTNEQSRTLVHTLRDEVDAVCVGINTVLQDNPNLTVRLRHGGRNPVRVIMDTHLKTPLDANVLSEEAPTFIFCAKEASPEQERLLMQKGATVVRVEANDVGIDLRAVMNYLSSRGILHVLVEGGATIAGSLLQEQLVNRLWLFHAPKILGQGKSAIAFQTAQNRMSDAILLTDIEHKMLGDDWLTIGTPIYPTRIL